MSTQDFSNVTCSDLVGMYCLKVGIWENESVRR